MKPPLFLSALILTATTSFAQHHGDGRVNPRSMDGPDTEIANLTPDQKAEIKKLRAAHRTETAPLAEQLKTKHEQLNAYRSAGNIDQAKVNAAIEEIYALKAKLAIKRAENEKAVRDLLTPEQQVHFDAKRNERRENKKARHAPHDQ